MKEMVLNLEEIKKWLELEKNPEKRSLGIYEIGALLIDEEEKEAEKFLEDLPDSGLESDRFLAFCFLSFADNNKLEEETRTKLRSFRQDMANSHLVEKAQFKIEQFEKKRRIEFAHQN